MHALAFCTGREGNFIGLYTCVACSESLVRGYSLLYSMGAPVMVELEGETDPLKIATKELK